MKILENMWIFKTMVMSSALKLAELSLNLQLRLFSQVSLSQAALDSSAIKGQLIKGLIIIYPNGFYYSLIILLLKSFQVAIF